MKKRLLGNTGMEVSVIGFGGIPIQHVSEEEAINLILECKRQGINFIDTARAYTISEKYIGKGLKEAGRENFYIATKAMSYDYDSMKKSIEESLNNLDIECIDLYQLHNVGSKRHLDTIFSENGAMKALLEAKAQGLIKHIGITSHTREILMEAIVHDELETVQFPFNPIESQGTEVLLKALDKGMGTIAMKPLAGGAFDNPRLSLKYIMNSNLITVAIPGMDTIEQVVENAGAGIDSEPLTQEEQDIINKEVESLGTDFCRRCGYCKPCPEGIDIPNVFVFENYVIRYKMPEYGKLKYDTLEVKPDQCVRCRKCEKKCPYNLPIVEKLKHAVKTFKELE
ncbi:MAG TPA: aldo/keto reductase [Sedimentibacter sp.]|nr:aldo/keto reductase [Sedimentibacter sp.]HQB63515.1 aldo/keto reductase [Sedimentibacter sp.]